MLDRLRAALGPILALLIFLGVVFLFLGLEMSSPYTRADPECSVWCVLEHKARAMVGLSVEDAVD